MNIYLFTDLIVSQTLLTPAIVTCSSIAWGLFTIFIGVGLYLGSEGVTEWSATYSDIPFNPLNPLTGENVKMIETTLTDDLRVKKINKLFLRLVK